MDRSKAVALSVSLTGVIAAAVAAIALNFGFIAPATNVADPTPIVSQAAPTPAPTHRTVAPAPTPAPVEHHEGGEDD